MVRLAIFLFAAGTLFAQESAPSDRVNLPPLLDSWYRAFDGAEHTGYFHETLTRTGEVGRPYEYAVEAAFEITLPDSPACGCRVRAMLTLSADLRILSGTWETTYAGSAPEILRVREGDDTPYLAPGPLTLRLRQRGDLAKSGAPAVKTLKVGVDGMVDHAVLDKPVRVTPIRIDGNATGPFATALLCWVDRYGRIVELRPAKGRGLSLVLARTSSDAKAAPLGLPNPGRRDPFSKEGVLTRPAGPEPEDLEKEPVLPEPGTDADAELAVGEILLNGLRDAVAARDDAEAGRRYQEFLRHHVANAPLFGDPMRRIGHQDQKARAEQLHGGVQRLLDDAAASLARISDLYEAARPEAIDGEMTALKKHLDRLEFFRDPRREEIERAIAKAASFRKRAQARRDLADRKIALTGVITGTEEVLGAFSARLQIGGFSTGIEERWPIHHEFTYAVINGDAYREREVVPGLGVRIERILRHAVVVSLDGEVREVPFTKD